MTRCFMPVSLCTCRPDGQHRVLGHRLNARGQVHVPLLDVRFRIARRAAEQIVEPPVRHRQALAVVEVLHVEPEAAVGLQVDQVL